MIFIKVKTELLHDYLHNNQILQDIITHRLSLIRKRDLTYCYEEKSWDLIGYKIHCYIIKNSDMGDRNQHKCNGVAKKVKHNWQLDSLARWSRCSREATKLWGCKRLPCGTPVAGRDILGGSPEGCYTHGWNRGKCAFNMLNSGLVGDLFTKYI